MNLNKEFLSEVIKYLINRGVTLTDVLDTFNEHFNTLDAFNDSLKNMPTEIKHGTINNVIEEPVLPKYTLTESDKISLESVSLSPETLNKVFETSEEHEKHDEVRKPITDIDLLLCGRSVEENSTPCQKVDSNRDLCQKVKKNAENTEKPVNKSLIDYPKNIENHGNVVSPARKALFDVINGKTVIEHLKENGITYSNFDNRIRKNWSVAEACTTPLASWGKGKRKRVIEVPEESEESKAVIVPDNVKVVEESSTPEKPTESVTNATALNGNNVTAVILDTPNPDAIREDKNDIVQKALKKFVTHAEESKKPKEPKKDYTVTDVCFKLNVTTHELKKMINSGEFPHPDCDKKWSVKLLKKEGII